jgi:hypothetical protein
MLIRIIKAIYKELKSMNEQVDNLKASALGKQQGEIK